MFESYTYWLFQSVPVTNSKQIQVYKEKKRNIFNTSDFLSVNLLNSNLRRIFLAFSRETVFWICEGIAINWKCVRLVVSWAIMLWPFCKLYQYYT